LMVSFILWKYSQLFYLSRRSHIHVYAATANQINVQHAQAGTTC
jgi:hypothetical protein